MYTNIYYIYIYIIYFIGILVILKRRFNTIGNINTETEIENIHL